MFHKHFLFKMKMIEMLSYLFQGLSHTATEDSESSLLLAARWRQKHAAHRQQEVLEWDTDDLGLRIVEGNDIPPALTQIFHMNTSELLR